MEMKKLVLRKLVILVVTGLCVFINSGVFGHDEGHGPKLTDQSKYGGVIAPVIKSSEAKLGRHAVLVYKAELLRRENGFIEVYFYDQAMKPLNLTGFEATGQAVLEIKKNKKNKEWITTPFELTRVKNHFQAKLPAVSRKPYNIDVRVKKGKVEFLAAFDNLD